ncbi:hypothetical protein IWX90DRAFT_51599 [Phyllosticta citrichinensis]|uniref:Uncharacterized protein n=1 Tax=Phyllosticta citrichinensis TaxID=1130410 RepID=A0ABR1XIP9_9PEZI
MSIQRLESACPGSFQKLLMRKARLLQPNLAHFFSHQSRPHYIFVSLSFALVLHTKTITGSSKTSERARIAKSSHRWQKPYTALLSTRGAPTDDILMYLSAVLSAAALLFRSEKGHKPVSSWRSTRFPHFRCRLSAIFPASAPTTEEEGQEEEEMEEEIKTG